MKAYSRLSPFISGSVILCLFLLSSCAAQPAQPGGLRVLAAETWLADIAQNVAGQRVQVDVLVPAGVDPHEFQPAPQDAIKIARANVLIVNGLGYETWLTKSLQDVGGNRTIVTATQGMAPSGNPPDPHMWMNPLNAVLYVANIRDALTQADPAGKDTYAANADAYTAKLKELDASIKSQVAQIPPEKRLLVTNHDALGYFAQAYGFQVVGAVVPSVTPESSPSAQQMAGLIDTVKRTKAPALFLDVSENRKLADEISSSTGAKVVTDLYVETLSAPSGPAPTYIDMMKHDAQVIADALR
jgi:zinc/manganese transport system substrate-binding protein